MLRKIFLITAVLWQFLFLNIYSQEKKTFYFENISIPDGLSNAQVWDIVQDKYGFLWIGTQDGLNRYDGYNIRIFKNDPEKINSLPNNTVQGLCIDHEDDLLVGTNLGLSIYNND